ncbi:MAG TPA: hypothetical protein VMV94_12745 [Phycisphaerae bacterium]|nr:hypothetical protein [Phycisphaerae bacterium]
MFKTISLAALVAVSAMLLFGCGTCPLAQYDTNGDGSFTQDDNYDVNAFSATFTSVAGDPVMMLTCSSYLQRLYPFAGGEW